MQVMARLLQVKHELVRFNPRIKSDYISLEDLLIDLKLPPAQLEVPIPNFFREGMLVKLGMLPLIPTTLMPLPSLLFF